MKQIHQHKTIFHFSYNRRLLSVNELASNLLALLKATSDDTLDDYYEAGSLTDEDVFRNPLQLV